MALTDKKQCNRLIKNVSVPPSQSCFLLQVPRSGPLECFVVKKLIQRFLTRKIVPQHKCGPALKKAWKCLFWKRSGMTWTWFTWVRFSFPLIWTWTKIFNFRFDLNQVRSSWGKFLWKIGAKSSGYLSLTWLDLKYFGFMKKFRFRLQSGWKTLGSGQVMVRPELWKPGSVRGQIQIYIRFRSRSDSDIDQDQIQIRFRSS